MKAALSIGIIGGAVGPTAVLVTGRFPWEIVVLGVIIVIAVIWTVKKRK